MKVYFYNTRLTTESYNEWKQGRFPGHILYGQPELEKYGMQFVMHPYRHFPGRFRLMLYVLRAVLSHRHEFDAIYATSFRGLELVIFLHALGLLRQPVYVWHHTAVTRASNLLREMMSRLFYRGIDGMFFFCQRHVDESLRSPKAPASKVHLVHWGPDLSFYDLLRRSCPAVPMTMPRFISTGKENRDIDTLLRAFAVSRHHLDVYIAEKCGNINYRRVIEALPPSPNIDVHFTDGVIPYRLAQIVAGCTCVVIPCLDFPYTVGLTTLVEALALGLPLITSRNGYFPMDIDAEGIGITVPYGDVQGWTDAVEYIAAHPDEARLMGERARLLAERVYNMEVFGREIADVINKDKFKSYDNRHSVSRR